MFVANTITVWTEALKALFDSNYVNPDLRDVTIGVDYPQQEVEYPNIWVNFAVNGEVSNAGIGHYELVDAGAGAVKEAFRWTFAGHIEFVVGTMGNLERALLVDEVSKAIAVGRVGENDYGTLRETVQNNDLIGLAVSWESFVVGGFGENVGTPWGTDDVIYEASISIPIEGEVILDPVTGNLIPLSTIRITPLGPGEGDPPTPGPGVGIGTWV